MTAFIIILLSPGVFGQSLEDLYPPLSPVPEEVKTFGETHGTVPSEHFRSLIPRVSLADRIPSYSGVVGAQSLFLLPFTPEGDSFLFLANKLTAVSTMQGINYYSSTRGKTRTLFTRAFIPRVAGTKDAAPDPVFRTPPDNLTLEVFLEDTTFGEGWYAMTLSTAGDCLLAGLTNKTPLSLGPVKVLDEEEMELILLVVPLPGELLLYASGTARLGKNSLLEKYVERSLYYRIQAMKEWLVEAL